MRPLQLVPSGKVLRTRRIMKEQADLSAKVSPRNAPVMTHRRQFNFNTAQQHSKPGTLWPWRFGEKRNKIFPELTEHQRLVVGPIWAGLRNRALRHRARVHFGALEYTKLAAAFRFAIAHKRPSRWRLSPLVTRLIDGRRCQMSFSPPRSTRPFVAAKLRLDSQIYASIWCPDRGPALTKTVFNCWPAPYSALVQKPRYLAHTLSGQPLT